jgi:hypothetical protein
MVQRRLFPCEPAHIVPGSLLDCRSLSAELAQVSVVTDVVSVPRLE